MKRRIHISILTLLGVLCSTNTAVAMIQKPFRNGVTVRVFVHPQKPLVVSVPELIHEVSLGLRNYDITRSLRSVEVKIPPLALETDLIIYTVSDQRVTVTMRLTKFIEKAVTSVEFVHNPHEKRAYLLEATPVIGWSRTAIDGRTSTSIVSGVSLCGIRQFSRRIAASVCAAHTKPNRMTASAGRCRLQEGQPECRAETLRAINISTVEAGAGAKYGQRLVLRMDTRIGIIVAHHSRSWHIEYVPNLEEPGLVVAQRDAGSKILPSASASVGLSYRLHGAWGASLAVGAKAALPGVATDYLATWAQAGLYYAL